MKLRGFGLVIVLFVVTAIGANAFASFEPLFQVIKVTGECSLKIPKGNDFVPAEESKAYPYGTKVRTGMRSSLVIVFSEGNVCRVLANADLTMSESTTNKKLKIIRLNEGEVEVELLEDFHSDGNALNVETATAICGAIGCKFRVASKTEEQLRIIIIRCIEGMIRVNGENFSAAELDEGDWLSLLTPPDLSFLRLKTMQGEFEITIKDENLGDRNLPTEEGTVLKIWQRRIPGTGQRVVVAELTGPDGKLIATVTATFKADSTTTLPVQDKPGDEVGERPQGSNIRPGNPQPIILFDGYDPDPDPGDDAPAQGTDSDLTPLSDTPATTSGDRDPTPSGRR